MTEVGFGAGAVAAGSSTSPSAPTSSTSVDSSSVSVDPIVRSPPFRFRSTVLSLAQASICLAAEVCMRTCVRAGADDPPRRPRRVLRLGRAARRPAPPRPAGDRRRRGHARRELRGADCGVRTAMGGGSRGSSAPRRSSSRRARPFTSRRQGGLPRVRGRLPLVEGVSIDEAFLDVRGPGTSTARRRRSPGSCAATCAMTGLDHGRRRADKFLARSQAASRSPTACCSCRPTASSRFSIRSRSSGSWASAPSRKLRLLDRDCRRGRRAHEDTLVTMLGRARPAPARARANRDPGRCTRVGAGARSARSARLAGARGRRTSSTRR